jgi:uncharacterized protein (DUF952 family)
MADLPDGSPEGPIFHLALAQEWEAAVASGGPYDRSTIGRSLADEGLIHCCFPDQVAGVAGLHFAGRDDLVLLTIDVARLDTEVRVEKPVGTDHAFPHIYGAVPLDAVVEERPYP